MSIWLKQSTSITIKFGPFVDKGDGVTLETGLATAMDNASTGIRLSKNGGNYADRNDSTAPVYDETGDYDIVLDATDTNTLGSLKIIFEEAATCLPHWQTFMVVPANVWDSLFGADKLQTDVAQWLGTAAATPTTAGVPEVDVTYVSGDSTAADNLELQYDTTGLTGDTFPSTQSQLSSIANVGAATNKPADSYTLTTGTQSANTVGDTEALNGTKHTHTDDAGAMDLYYEFVIGSGTATSVTATGALTSNNDDLEVHGYDWVSASWKQIGTMAGKNSTANEVDSYELFVDMVGSGANEGKVRVRFTDGAFTLSSATLYIDQIFVSFAQGVEGYDMGAVWLDTSASNTGTEVGIDGTARNPVSTIAAANTLLASTNLARLEIAPASSITLAATQTAQVFNGYGWALALGSQDIDNSHFFGSDDVSGVGTSSTKVFFHDSLINTASVQKATFFDCSFGATVTFTLAGDYNIVNSQSDIAGASAPTFTKTAGQAITAQWRRWSGGITMSGIESGDTFTISGELGTVTLNGADGTVDIRGTYKAIVDNRTGTPTLNTDGAIKGVDVASILTDTVEIGTAGAGLTDLGGMSTGMKAEVNAEALDVINTDTFAEPGQGAPGATVSLVAKIGYLYKAWRNKADQTSSTYQLYNDNASTVDHKATVSDNGTTATKGEVATGP